MCKKMEGTNKLYFLLGNLRNSGYNKMVYTTLIMAIFMLLIGIYVDCYQNIMQNNSSLKF